MFLHNKLLNRCFFYKQLVRSLPFGHETRFQFALRPNEPRRVSIRPDNSFWQAYDATTNFPLYINGRHHLETHYLAYGTNLDARINSRKVTFFYFFHVFSINYLFGFQKDDRLALMFR